MSRESRHRRQLSQVLPPEFIAGDDLHDLAQAPYLLLAQQQLLQLRAQKTHHQKPMGKILPLTLLRPTRSPPPPDLLELECDAV
ncbi:unnamed protein product [Prunus armeniaca]|uniref:Uncharacterized protein n=1 Tax=Prunus armeniaca TaxID=36596 RepID=A0A6J5X5W9_PRUAR|nr:unnamed protein product [Prunus armeniaca]